MVWQDWRELKPNFNIWAQRLDVDSKAIGGNTRLVAEQAESPSTAVGTGSIGMAWGHTEGKRHEVWFGTWDRTLKPLGAPVKVSADGLGGVYPTLVWNGSRYVVAWYDPDSPIHAVYGAVYGEKGETLVAARKLTDSPRFSRYPTMLPLGDRMLLVWSDTKDLNSGYELYSKMLDDKLGTIDPERRITRAIGDSVTPVASFGPKGDVGVLFRDDRLGAVHVWFSRLVCATATK